MSPRLLLLLPIAWSVLACGDATLKTAPDNDTDGGDLQVDRDSNATDLTADADGRDRDASDADSTALGDAPLPPDTTGAEVSGDVGSDTSASTLDTSTPVDTGPVCGDGVVGAGEACDDGNTAGGDTCSPTCEPTYPCGPLGGSCAAVSATVTEHHLAAIDGCKFALGAPTSTTDAAIDALVARAGGALTMEDILGDLNRTGVAGISAANADRLKNHAWKGFRWNSGDNAVTYWYPQGITSSSDARDNGRVGGKRTMLVSWYDHDDVAPNKGVRVSLADLTNLSAVTYRHLLLVVPSTSGGAVNVAPVTIHAGGIVWYGDYLYVADTSRGLRVFDLTRIVRVSHVDDSDALGITASRFDAYGYRYAIPQLALYRLTTESCPVIFSFAGLDRSTSPPRIVSGEYDADRTNGRLVSWQLDPSTGLLDVRQGQVRGVDAYLSGQDRMQGALTWNGNVYISSSGQYYASTWGLNFGRLYRTRPGMQSSISAWVYGAEDLTYERDTGLIWTAAEHPNYRDVVGIPLRVP